jgi:hypothetical protein
MASFQGLPGFVGPNTSTGQDVGRGLTFTRIKGPGMAGQIADGAGGTNSPGPLPPAAGFICIQSTASLTNQIVTTSATGLLNASFMYIPVTTGSLVGAGAPAYTGVGTPIVWNDALFSLNIWSSSKASWVVLVTSSGGVAGFTTSG